MKDNDDNGHKADDSTIPAAFTLYSPGGQHAANPLDLARLQTEIVAWKHVLENGMQYEPARLLYVPLLVSRTAAHSGII
jgi:hypothetical protein